MEGVLDTASYFTPVAQKEKKKLDKTLPWGGVGLKYLASMEVLNEEDSYSASCRNDAVLFCIM